MSENKNEVVNTSQANMTNQAFHLPLKILNDMQSVLGDVVSSAKLSSGQLDVNRYYVRIVSFGEYSHESALEIIARQLDMPTEALNSAKAELAYFGSILFVGAGASINEMAYRVYFGFGVDRSSSGPTGSSIDWRAGTPKFLVKKYTEHGNVERKKELDLLKTCLSSTPNMLANDQLRIYEQCAEITRDVKGALQTTEVMEPESGRHSVAFNYYWAKRTPLNSIRNELEQIAETLLIPRPVLDKWIADSRALRIIDIAAGLDGNKDTFLTVYLGETNEPPPLCFYNSSVGVEHENIVQQSTAPFSLVPGLQGLKELHSQSYGDSSIIIAIIDGHPDLSHPCLFESMIEVVPKAISESSISGAGSSSVMSGPATDHATAVASLIFGGVDTSITGVAPQCRGLIIPVFNNSNDPASQGCTQAELASAIQLAADNGAHIINISAGQMVDAELADPKLLHVVQHCVDQGILIVAASGNEGCICDHVPAALPGVLVVGGISENGEPDIRSNVSDTYIERGIVAPSENVLVAKAGGGVTVSSGTSFAAALVSGVAALLSSVLTKHNLTHRMQDIFDALITSAIDCAEQPSIDCHRLLSGRLSISGAHQLLIEMKGENMETNPEANSESPSLVTASGGGDPVCQCQTATPEAQTRPQAQATNEPEKVYAIGYIDVEYSSRARRDSFQQAGLNNPEDNANLVEFLKENPAHAPAVTWLLVQENIPIYAVRPSGAFTREVFEMLCNILGQQSSGSIERVSVPGIITGTTTLSDGSSVPVLWPDIRGMYGWATAELVATLEEGQDSDHPPSDALASELSNFLDRVYYEFRNTGTIPADRALNFAATNALQANDIFCEALNEGLSLESISVEKSQAARSGSEIYEVKLKFFHPKKLIEQAKVVYRYMVDVSDIIPVTVGEKRRWNIS